MSDQRQTVSLPEAADLLGIGRNTAYAEVRRSGQLAGVPVIRIGRRLLVGRIPLNRVLHGLPAVPSTTPALPAAAGGHATPVPTTPHPSESVAPAAPACPPARLLGTGVAHP